MHFAHLDAEGRAIGFYNDVIHASIPTGAVPIPEETWQVWIGNTATQRWDGVALVACDPPAAPLPTAQQQRARRNARLAASDWTQMPDAPLTTEARAAWAVYRQALRDVPELGGFPAEVTWPEEPVA